MKQLLYRAILFLVLLCPFAISISCNNIEGTVEFEFSPPIIKPDPGKDKETKPHNKAAQPKQVDSVLICESSTAYAYHKGYCSGLSRCKADVVKLPKKKAEEMGRRPCKICY